ncbi:hypothetical protein KP509_14G069200 [Ceratopteris richardii]|nr:hypothetical protein KP509_14G069200 [Ceratopteris richardii]
MAKVPPIRDCTKPNSSSQIQKLSDINNFDGTDHDEEGSEDEDDDRNHKHRRRVERSRSLDRDIEDGPLRKRNKFDDSKSTEEFQKGPAYPEKDGFPKRRQGRDYTFGPAKLGMDGNQRGLLRGVSAVRNDGLGSRFEHQNGFPRGFIGRGRGGTPLLGAREQRSIPVDASDPSALLLPQGFSKNAFNGRPGSGRGNPSHSPWLGYNRFTGITNNALEHSLPLNTGIQGPRNVPISPGGVGMNIGLGLGLRPRCPDFEERGFCLRGDLCPMDHGANRIVVEDVQSLSKFNLPVTLPSGRGSMPVSSSTLVSFSSNVTRDPNMPPLLESNFSKAASGNYTNVEPELYDPDQPLWNKEQPTPIVDGLRKLSSFRKDTECESSALERSKRQSPEDEAHGRMGRLQGQGSGQSVWNRIGRIEQCDMKDTTSISVTNDFTAEGLHNPKLMKREAHGLPNSPGRRKSDPEERLLRSLKGLVAKSGGNGTSEGGIGSHRPVYTPQGGRVLRLPIERAQNTLYVGCLPDISNCREHLAAHFQKFGEIIDIRIPVNGGGRAFVQFLRHEDAEAALASPDAVMGNRFIRLSWAKRDSIPIFAVDNNSVLPSAVSGKDSGSGETEELVLDSSASAEKGNKQIDVMPAALEAKNRSAMKSGTLSETKVTLKRQEEREQMREKIEEIRRKQEELAQKRDEFRRALERLSKQQQGNGAKGAISDQSIDKQAAAESGETDDKGLCKQTSFASNVIEKIPDQAALGPTKESSKQPLSLGQVHSAALSQPSPRGKGHPFRPGSGSPWSSSRYKIDNRTTVFRVLAPLPEGFLDTGVIKQHFQSFGEVVNVLIEDLSREGESNDTEHATVMVTFSNRSVAEKAFTNGRQFQGVSMQFSWVNLPGSATGALSSEDLGTELKSRLICNLNDKVSADGQSSRAQISTTRDSSDKEAQIEAEHQQEDVSDAVLCTSARVCEGGNGLESNGVS